MFARNDVRRLIVIEAVTLEPTRPKVFHIEIALDTGAGLKAARAEKRSVEGIEAEGLVTTAAKGIRQAARNMT